MSNDKSKTICPLPVENHICAGVAAWMRGRVVSIPHRAAAVVIMGDIEHVISREQAVALGTRLLEVGIGTTYADERSINARIADLVMEAKALKNV